jgi:hypothetical protein
MAGWNKIYRSMNQHQLDNMFVKHQFRKNMNDVWTLPGADIDCNHNLLIAKIHTKLQKIMKSQKWKARWHLEKLHAQWKKVQDTLEEKTGAIKCESGNVEVQWNNSKKCVLRTLSDCRGKDDRRARKPWITQEMIN